MKKNILILTVSFLFIFTTGCELVRKVPNTNDPNNPNIGTDQTSVSEEPVMNPSDHIFDIDLDRIRTDLEGKKLDGEPNWTLKSTDILDSEFGGSSLSQGKMESRYYLRLKNGDAQDTYESAIVLNYEWDKTQWNFMKVQQAYMERLEEGETKLSREDRKSLMEEYNNKPKLNDTPSLSDDAVEDENPEEIIEDDAVEEEADPNLTNEEDTEEDIVEDTGEDVVEENIVEDTEEDVVEEDIVEDTEEEPTE